jgi:F-type H+-transporting ATPase subunit b
MLSARLAIVCLILGVATVSVAASEGGGGSSLIEPNVGTIFWTTVTFVILAFLLGRFAWKPLLGALQERERSIQESIDQARGDREQAEKLLEDQRQLLEQARRERAEAVTAGQRDAEKVKAEILEEARQQREKLLSQTQAQVEAGLRQARSELRVVAADLAIKAAEKLLTKNLDDASQRKLVEDYLADLERSNSPPS